MLVHTVIRYQASGGETLEQLIPLIEDLVLFDEELRESDAVVRKEDLLYTDILPDYPLYEFLYNAQRPGYDTRKLLALTLDKTSTIGNVPREDKSAPGELGPWGGDLDCEINNFSQWNDWMRNCLRNFDGSAEEFHRQCRNVFPTLIFSNEFPNCLKTFDGNLSDFTGEIIKALSALADLMPQCMLIQNPAERLPTFSSNSGFETTMEGNSARKGALTFEFVKRLGEGCKKVDVVCEPHMKMSDSSKEGDSKYYQHRLYFSSGNHAEFPGCILVGHIGAHK